MSNLLDFFKKDADFPVGSITPFMPGHFTNTNNGGFNTIVGGNTISGVNGHVNKYGWHVCDGAAIDLAGTPIFAGAGRHLPNLVDRFIMGSVTATHTAGGAARHNHSSLGGHTINQSTMLRHRHVCAKRGTLTPVTGGLITGKHATPHVTGNTGGGKSHAHTIAMADNNPPYVKSFYIIKVTE